MRLLIRYAVLAGLIAMCAGIISVDMRAYRSEPTPGTPNHSTLARLVAGR